MIITSARNTPVTSGASDFVDYKIDTANLGHIASILRKAYSDPIRAVVREYGTNACEAHMLNNKQGKPFEVTLPTKMASTFKIRDFGPGLGVDSFKNLFCSYGGSSKRTSNQFTGCLGIGCKSYGAYTDSCAITDIHDGTKRIWNCFIDESEVGKATMLSESKAYDSSGVEIAIAVRPDDVDRFRSTAISVYKVFDVKPSITNLSKQELEEYGNLEYKNGSIKGPNWSFRGDGRSWLQMGLVLYPLKDDFAGPSSIRNLIKAGVYVRVDLGEVQIAPSREDLQYSQKTIQALVKHLTPVVNTLGDQLVAEIAKAPDFISAHRVLSGFSRGDYQSSEFRQSIIKKVKDRLQWNNIPLASDFTLELAKAVEDKKGDVIASPKTVLENHGITLIRISKRNYGKTKFNVDREDHRLHISGDIELFFNDIKGHGTGESRVRHWLANGSKDITAYVLSCRNGGKAYLETSLPWFKHVNFRSLDALPKPPPSIKAVDSDGNEVEVTKCKKHGKGNIFALSTDKYQFSRKLSDHWRICPTPDSVCYAEIDQFKFTMKGLCGDSYDSFYRLRDLLAEISPIENIHGVKASDVKAKVQSKWMTVADALTHYVPKYFALNPDKAQKLSDYIVARRFFQGRYENKRFPNFGNFFERDDLEKWFLKEKGRPSTAELLPDTSPCRVYLENLWRMMGQKRDNHNYTELPLWLGFTEDAISNMFGSESKEAKAILGCLPKPSFDLKTSSHELVKRYPLFVCNTWSREAVSSPAFNHPGDATVQYVNLIDEDFERKNKTTKKG